MWEDRRVFFRYLQLADDPCYKHNVYDTVFDVELYWLKIKH